MFPTYPVDALLPKHITARHPAASLQFWGPAAIITTVESHVSRAPFHPIQAECAEPCSVCMPCLLGSADALQQPMWHSELSDTILCCRSPSNGTARLLFRASLLHLPILLACLLIHRIPNQPSHLQPSSQQLWARLRLSLLPSLWSTSPQLASPAIASATSCPDIKGSQSSGGHFGAQNLPVPFPFLPVPLDSWQASSSSSSSSSIQGLQLGWSSSSKVSQSHAELQPQPASVVKCSQCQQSLQVLEDQDTCCNACRHLR